MAGLVTGLLAAICIDADDFRPTKVFSGWHGALKLRYDLLNVKVKIK